MIRIRSRGFSLLEVMIAVLVFSLGLLGVGGLMVLSVRTNHSAFLRTQASFLAGAMADRIRANTSRASLYNGTYNASSAASGSNSCTTAPCTPDGLVQRDRDVWSRQLVTALPNPTATVNCAGSQLGSTLFDGLCSIVIQWTEADLQKGTSATPQAPGMNTFAWVFQP
jgi:type IV pilus assembly protein PilV